jgi:hypothetical protein
MGVGPYFAVTGSQCDRVSLGEFLDFSKDLLEASGPKDPPNDAAVYRRRLQSFAKSSGRCAWPVDIATEML